MILEILVLTAIVFLSRYVFLEPRVPLRIGARAKRFLDYSTPAVLSAIWGPIVFMPHGQLSWADNAPYVLGAAAALALAWKTKNVLLTTVLGMGVFTVLKMWVFA